MSLAHSHLEDLPEGADPSTSLRLRRAETRPRTLQRPDSFQDLSTATLRDATQLKPFSKPSGNAKPQEPGFFKARHKPMPFPKDRGAAEDARRKQVLNTMRDLEMDSPEWTASAKDFRRMTTESLPPNRNVEHRPERPLTPGHIHPKPWSSSPQPGKKENPSVADSTFHRTWMQNGADQAGKWTSWRTKQHYLEQDKALYSLRPTDEKFAVGTNMKYWSHLESAGERPGGQHKLELTPDRGIFEGQQSPENRCRCTAACKRGACGKTGRHLKSGLYRGKFENVKHAQLWFQMVDTEDRQTTELRRDPRVMFDNRLTDDMIQHNHDTDKEAAIANYDMFRPAHTFSCPQLGADFVNR
mmetsp:Transcript_93174/g.268157  ORF Transcript_93174/g.268157 Transcript_93174/m.268157 type:complete len:356 (-) Transcript_93174:334-1401(-)